MKERLLKMLHSIIAVGAGLLFLILLVLPYVESIDGYLLTRMYDMGLGFLGFAITIMQFLHIVSLIVLVAVGVLGILKITGVVEIKKYIKGWNYVTLLKLVLTVVASLSLIVMVLGLILCGTEGAHVGVGLILNTILEILACVAFYVLDIYGFLDGTYAAKESALKQKQQLKKQQKAEKKSTKTEDATDAETVEVQATVVEPTEQLESEVDSE